MCACSPICSPSSLGPQVVYDYDQADRLVLMHQQDRNGVGFAVTSMLYDLAGRKTRLVDPDMGTWNYTYDALNLASQADGRGQWICLYYDLVQRLSGKHYRPDSACPSSPTLNVTYTYDQGTNGKGR